MTVPLTDDWANAPEVVITVDGGTWTSAVTPMTGSNVLESGEPANPAGGPYGVNGRTVWCRYTPATTGSTTIDTGLSAAGDTEIGLYTGNSVGGLTRVAGDSDSDPAGNRSRLTYTCQAEETYWLQVGNYGGDTNSIQVRVTGPATAPPIDMDDVFQAFAVRLAEEFNALRASLGAPMTAETVRDLIGSTLVAGTGVTVVVNDAGDTVTVNASGAGQLDAETVRDTIAAMLVAGTGVTLTYNDAGDTLTVASTGGGGGLDAETVRDTIATMLVAGTGVTLTYNDAGDTLTVAATGGGGAGDYWTKAQIGDVLTADFVARYEAI